MKLLGTQRIVAELLTIAVAFGIVAGVLEVLGYRQLAVPVTFVAAVAIGWVFELFPFSSPQFRESLENNPRPRARWQRAMGLWACGIVVTLIGAIGLLAPGKPMWLWVSVCFAGVILVLKGRLDAHDVLLQVTLDR